jgi:2-polyprenyl-6-methoxyphenol hydroxylase-like FAD-dependent oxidoreductase
MKILIVGGGIGGMATAIRAADAGHEIELIDLDTKWRVYGAGITITGPTLRAYKRLGLIDAIKAEGAITNGVRIYRYDGVFIRELDEPALEEGLPATGGIMRPVLHHIMQERVRALGVKIALGQSVMRVENLNDSVEVEFSSGATGRYDVVVGADGVSSSIRCLVFPDAIEPAETGQACWRISTRRPPGFDLGEFYFGHEYPVGVTACAPDAIYMWMLTKHERGFRFDEGDGHARLRDRIGDFGGTVGWIRDNMRKSDWVNYRPLSAALQPGPWARGRIVLLGDSAHATTPHLASGAGMAVEDALVLIEELGIAERAVEDSLLAYSARRFPRCKMVVETSIQAGRMQLEGTDPEAQGKLIGGALHQLAAEY